MPFIETEAKKEIKEINGKPTVVLTPECEVTLKNLKRLCQLNIKEFWKKTLKKIKLKIILRK